MDKSVNKNTIIAAFILLGAAGVLSVLARTAGGFAEWYSTGVYPLIVATVGRMTGAVPVSVGETAVFLLPLIIIADVIRCRKKLRRALSHIFLITAVIAFLYAANCGVNYYRDPFTDADAVSQASFTEDDLSEFCEYIAGRLDLCCSGENGSPDYPQGGELAGSAVESMRNLSIVYPSLDGYYPEPKQLRLLSRAFSGMGISGIYSPFTVEANINGEMPDMEKPFTACHELSHLRGYMNEGEANFIGWLACIGSDDPAFVRSGWLIAWNYAGGTLRRVDPGRYEEILKKLPEESIRELADNHEFWVSHETGASEIQDRVNDSYLRANGQEQGIRSYGQLTTLMLMWYAGDA